MSPSAQNTDEIPVVQTKAKINKGLSRGASHFGAESMFESSSTYVYVLFLFYYVKVDLSQGKGKRSRTWTRHRPVQSMIYSVRDLLLASPNGQFFLLRAYVPSLFMIPFN